MKQTRVYPVYDDVSERLVGAVDLDDLFDDVSTSTDQR